MDKERARLDEARTGAPWRKWGPYLSERQWGTVREDYSESGNAWDYFSHDQARSRAYRRGEDGIAGVCDDTGSLCFALAFWNGKDPIVKERIFGLTNSEGNHGEDPKEYYYYLDCTPTHSFMRYLYKYPQAAYPYDDLVATNRRRSRHEHEYELLDTGVFDDDRYFDIFVEYAKAGPEDLLVRVRIHNRGDAVAELHVLPTLWFKNTWSWGGDPTKPQLSVANSPAGTRAVNAAHATLGSYLLYCEGSPELLFTENETNEERINGTPNRSPYVKDGIVNCVVEGRADLVNPAHVGTKVAAHYRVSVPAGGEVVLRLRLRDAAPVAQRTPFGVPFDDMFIERQADADDFFAGVVPPTLGEDQQLVVRQALAGMLWSKQLYNFIGAPHQTGWTGLVAKQIELFARMDAKTLLQQGSRAAFGTVESPNVRAKLGSKIVA